MKIITERRAPGQLGASIMSNPSDPAYKITDVAEMRVDPDIRSAVHPGALMAANLADFGLSVSEAARQMSVNRSNLSNVLNGKVALSHDLAYRLEALIGLDAGLLLAMQRAYDDAEAAPLRALHSRTITRVSRMPEAT